MKKIVALMILLYAWDLFWALKFAYMPSVDELAHNRILAGRSRSPNERPKEAEQA